MLDRGSQCKYSCPILYLGRNIYPLILTGFVNALNHVEENLSLPILPRVAFFVVGFLAFYFEIILEYRVITQIVQGISIYPSPSFPNVNVLQNLSTTIKFSKLSYNNSNYSLYSPVLPLMFFLYSKIQIRLLCCIQSCVLSLLRSVTKLPYLNLSRENVRQTQVKGHSVKNNHYSKVLRS